MINLKRIILVYLLVLWGGMTALAADGNLNPKAVTDLLDRIGGVGTSERFVTEVKPELASNGKDVFEISSKDGKPYIAGNSILSVTTGINWYLNHTAHVNLAWNNLTTNLAAATLPLPATAEKHVCTADYRYYLNYCTFSYSAAFWTWERWQKEIDWMALHGINMPLAIVGMDVVWKNILTELGYSKSEINDFVAGPGFQAWWLMNNLEGWGGPNKDWWYDRQEVLGKKILASMRDFGMTPVLPGYSGMVPSNITAKKGWAITDPGTWVGFQRPGFLVPTSSHFKEMATLYYEKLKEVMGTSDYYSMDPFHEGGNTAGVDLPAAYSAIFNAMDAENPKAKWVIQSWNENPRQECLTTIKKGKLIVLDLFSDGTDGWKGGYNGHEMVYCMLHNFGGRTGLHGRLSKTIDDYYKALAQYPNTLKGIGATPEGIETNPVLYDALFELPWKDGLKANTWLDEYSVSRYGSQSENAQSAWQNLLTSVYSCQTSQQGTSEPIILARPALQVGSVSTWSTSGLYYDPQYVIRAMDKMLAAGKELSGENYNYDLVDISRQALTDHAIPLLAEVKAAYDSKDTKRFSVLKDRFLNLILDIDKLLATNQNFMLGRWTGMAKAVADEGGASTSADKQWMEWNARKQITTWGNEVAANQGGLHDYSNREWSGLLKDFHYERWKHFFNLLEQGKSTPSWSEWYAIEDKWDNDFSKSYSDKPEGNSLDIAQQMFDKYFGKAKANEGDAEYYFAYGIENDAQKELIGNSYRSKAYTLDASFANTLTGKISVDFNGDGSFAAETETAEGTTINVPADALTGKHRASFTLTDGTVINFYVIVKDIITDPRTVTVASANESEGKVSIEGNDGNSVTSTSEVTIKATPVAGYDFLHWTNSKGEKVSSDNPYTYYGKEPESFTANFIVNKWGQPKENWQDKNDIQSYEQYVEKFQVAYSSGESSVLYETGECPSTLFNIIPSQVTTARGSSFTISWNDTQKHGLSYCRLSAYIDLNSDGDFTDKDELLEVRGGKQTSGNSTVSEGSLKVILPYDMPEGITHLRLRFDGSYATGWDAATDAMPAAAEAYRMVYDIVVNVTELPAHDVTVKVVSADESKGTVAISGLSNPATVKPGEKIIIQAQPKNGYQLSYWEDQYGRKVGTEANYSFIPTEDGTFTAHFMPTLPKELSLGDWNFSYQLTEADGKTEIQLDKPTKGEGALSIPANYSIGEGVSFPITSLAQGALAGNTKLTSLTIPQSVASIGGGEVFFNEVSGSGTADYAIVPEATISANRPWCIRMNVKGAGQASFNDWGSGLLATGSEALANDYSNGFQIYLSAGGDLIFKYGSESDKQTLSGVVTKGEASNLFIELAYDGKSSIALNAVNGDGKKFSATAKGLSLADITRLSTAIPKGIDIAPLQVEYQDVQTPFEGCSNLGSITVASANKVFASNNGVLYKKGYKTLLAYPEGKQAKSFSLLSQTQFIANKAFTANPYLDRISANAAQAPMPLGQAFSEAIKASVMVALTSADKAEAYSTGLGLNVLLTAAEGKTVSGSSSAIKAYEVNSGNGMKNSGSFDENSEEGERWVNTLLTSSSLSAVYLPSVPTRAYEWTDSAMVPTHNPLKADYKNLKIYKVVALANNAAGGKTEAIAYELTDSISSPGVYLVGLKSELADRRFVFRFASAKGDDETASTVILAKGNDGLSMLALNGGDTYLYDNENNSFVLNASSATVAPFEAYLQLADGSTQLGEIIAGPNVDVAIGNATQAGSGKWYKLAAGPSIVPATSGTTIEIYTTSGLQLRAGSKLNAGAYLVKNALTGQIAKVIVM